MLQKNQIVLTIPTIDLSLLKRIKGGYDPDGFNDHYFNGNIYNQDNYDPDNDSFDLGVIDPAVCKPGTSYDDNEPDESSLENEFTEFIEQDEPDEEHESEQEQDAGGSNTQFDLTAALQHLRDNAYDHYTREFCGHCARAIRMALEAGGLDTTGRPAYAGDYDSFLPTIGFIQVEYGPDYVPQPGDIVVHESTSENRPEGHIAMYDGANWISDYYQRDMFGGQAYRDNNDFTIWRYNQ